MDQFNISDEISNHEDVVNFLHNEKWEMTDHDTYRNLIISMYFGLTSLSTTGFGDFHPITELEMLVCIFILLIGVSMFSLIMGELGFMITNFQELNGDSSDNQELENFFVLLKKFNKGYPIN